jgi:hypothetical protein
MARLSQWNDQALRLAGQVGDTLKDAVPDRALRWVETGAALGALRTGSRTAGKFVRRHPVALVATAVGAGVVWYALRQRAKRQADAAQDEHGDVIEGRARRVEARRSRVRSRRQAEVGGEAGANA